MDENLIENFSTENQLTEPTLAENSTNENSVEASPNVSDKGGQSQDPSEELILGKFKTVEDLTKAYVELQKHQGQNSQELGELRKEASSINDLKENLKQALELQNKISETLVQDREKLDKPEYFQEPTFKNLYKEAFVALNGNLDTDKFVNLLDAYVASRVAAYEKTKLAEQETQQLVNSMTYAENSKNTFTPPKKSFDEMTPQEVEELLDRLI